ncbi:low molecular weight phosphatase family protein [Streptomyces sp. ST2-7A]|uniref:arsenate-mycothiol transferase ArsC n=1 Tax=Streptomyces sp. ST2-7A TaxID=2907214 RepID=UPI001F20E7D9|nr:arsenate reductase ArsC [Streptomyces sp. ST2-7A]MCE7079089.1 arsenate reductase ArsC [Streptomyces sp. ST2-7A]
MTALPPHRVPGDRLTSATLRLAARHEHRFSLDTVHHLLLDSHRRLAAGATIPDHLPLLAERLTGERLDALARTEGPVRSAVPHVLFVCGRNTGRSQLAAALLRHHSGERVLASSAGTDPGAAVSAEVARSLAEVGVEVRHAYPKPLTDEVIGAADVVVTMGCGDACPILPGRRYLNWPLPDPDGAPPRVVRAIRNVVDARVRELLAVLVPTTPAGTG